LTILVDDENADCEVLWGTKVKIHYKNAAATAYSGKENCWEFFTFFDMPNTDQILKGPCGTGGIQFKQEQL
jgi:hypothetical protein